MRFALCNFLGRLCSTYRFDDGAVVRRLTKESLAYVCDGKAEEILFYYDGVGAYEYYLPRNLSMAGASTFEIICQGWLCIMTLL